MQRLMENITTLRTGALELFAFGAAAGAAFLAAAELSLFALMRSSTKLVAFVCKFRTVAGPVYFHDIRLAHSHIRHHFRIHTQ